VSILPNLDNFFNLIDDGAWHSLKELSKHSNIPKQKLEALFKMLSETNIVEYETHGEQIRIKREWQKILKRPSEEQKYGGKAAVGTVLLPPKKNIKIQGIQLTNLTEKEIEISMRINKNLEELAIDIIE